MGSRKEEAESSVGMVADLSALLLIMNNKIAQKNSEDAPATNNTKYQ